MSAVPAVPEAPPDELIVVVAFFQVPAWEIAPKDQVMVKIISFFIFIIYFPYYLRDEHAAKADC